MGKRAKTVGPVLCVTLLVVAGFYVYLNSMDQGVETERAVSQSCDNARLGLERDGANAPGATASSGEQMVAKHCDRQGK